MDEMNIKILKKFGYYYDSLGEISKEIYYEGELRGTHWWQCNIHNPNLTLEELAYIKDTYDVDSEGNFDIQIDWELNLE